MPRKKKEKVYLEDISFEREDSHVALVGPAVGGPANNETTLLLKAEFTEEQIEKAANIEISMPIEEFMQVFKSHNIAEIEAVVGEEIQSLDLLKALDEDNYIDTLGNLDSEDYIAFLQDQAKIEKAFEAIKESDLKAKASGSDTQQNAGVEKKVEPSGSVSQVNKGNYMADKEVKTVVADVEKELDEKSVLVDLQKAFEEKAVELQKALDLVKQFEQEKKDAITKSRKEKLGAAVKNQEQADALFKGANLLEDADFEAFVKAVADIQAVADQSDLFKSVGADGVVDQKAEEGVSDIKKAFAKLKAKTK